MEEEGWKKDETPYLVIPCRKCHQYMYVKTTQKTKKCLRCGRTHKVSSILDSGEIVKGMTEAVELVKARQNELAIQELGTTPEFRAAEDFTVKSKMKLSSKEGFAIKSSDDDDNNLEALFKKMLLEISDLYDKIPYYILEIMAEDYAIPLSELKMLIRNTQKEGILIQLQDNSYRINK